jgi:hypothetical protein
MQSVGQPLAQKYLTCFPRLACLQISNIKSSKSGFGFNKTSLFSSCIFSNIPLSKVGISLFFMRKENKTTYT